MADTYQDPCERMQGVSRDGRKGALLIAAKDFSARAKQEATRT